MSAELTGAAYDAAETIWMELRARIAATPKPPPDAVAMLQVVPSFTMYQVCTADTSVYPGVGKDQLLYPAIGLADEALEVLEVVQKLYLAQYTNHFDPLLEDVLQIAVATGKLLGCIKKAWRDDFRAHRDEGVITVERGHKIREAIDSLKAGLEGLTVSYWKHPAVMFSTIVLDAAAKQELLKELGDACFYAAQLGNEAGINGDDILLTNATKLKDRKTRGVLRGSGDNR